MLACNAHIPIPREEAKVLKQHFQNNIMRPEIKGNFQSVEFFRIAEAYVIDDATNKKYDLFSSKFVEIGDEIVYDSVTNLLWLKNAHYFPKEFTYDDALKACKNIEIHGLSGWHIPSFEEIKRMRTVYRKQEIHPFINVREYYGCVNNKNVYCYFGFNDNRNGTCLGRCDDPIWPVR